MVNASRANDSRYESLSLAVAVCRTSVYSPTERLITAQLSDNNSVILGSELQNCTVSTVWLVIGFHRSQIELLREALAELERVGSDERPQLVQSHTD